MVEFLDNAEASYDALAKRILSRKFILSRILKRTVTEFENCSLEEIENCIEGDPTATINTVPVDDVLNISGRGNESNSPVEGLVTFDILFDAVVPNTDEKIKLIINIEPQKTTNTGYPILKRAIYYASRIISSQKEREFSGDDYGKIRKVYSIWICMDVPNYRANSIQRYHIFEDKIHGKYSEVIRNYDLLTVVVLNLGKSEMSDSLLEMLHLIFLKEMLTAEKEAILADKFSLRLTHDNREELKNVGGLLQAAANIAAEARIEKAVNAQKVEDSVISIRSIMANLKLTAEEAMNALNIPEAEQSKYLALI